MKKVRLNYPITVSAGASLETIDLSVNDIILPAIIETPQGVNFDGMGERISLIRKIKEGIKNNKPYVLLESSEYKSLVEALKSQRWVKIDPALYDYLQETCNLPDTEVEPTKSKK